MSTVQLSQSQEFGFPTCDVQRLLGIFLVCFLSFKFHCIIHITGLHPPSIAYRCPNRNSMVFSMGFPVSIPNKVYIPRKSFRNCNHVAHQNIVCFNSPSGTAIRSAQGSQHLPTQPPHPLTFKHIVLLHVAVNTINHVAYSCEN